MWDKYWVLQKIIRGAGFGRTRFLSLAEACCGSAFHYDLETHATTEAEDLRTDAQQKGLHRSICALSLPWKIRRARESVTGAGINRCIPKWSQVVRAKRVALACRTLARPQWHPFRRALVDIPGTKAGRPLKSLPGGLANRASWRSLVARDVWIPEDNLPREIALRHGSRLNLGELLSPVQIIIGREAEALSAGVRGAPMKTPQRKLNRLRRFDPSPRF